MTAFLQTFSFSTEDRFYTTSTLEKTHPKPDTGGHIKHRAERIMAIERQVENLGKAHNLMLSAEPCGWNSQPRV